MFAIQCRKTKLIKTKPGHAQLFPFPILLPPLQRENEAKEREMRDLEAFVKKENAERKKETRAIEEARCLIP